MGRVHTIGACRAKLRRRRTQRNCPRNNARVSSTGLRGICLPPIGPRSIASAAGRASIDSTTLRYTRCKFRRYGSTRVRA
jgi:hypothetical protein